MVPKPSWPQRCSSNPARTRSLPRSAAVALTTGQFVLNDWFGSDCAEQKNFCGLAGVMYGGRKPARVRGSAKRTNPLRNGREEFSDKK